MSAPLPPALDAALLPFTKSNDELPEDLARLCRHNLEEIDERLQQMEDLGSVQQAYRELLFPSRRLPNELILKIIQSCFKDPTILDAADRQVFAVLRSVCQRWRTISFSSHDLWRGLSVTDVLQDIGYKVESWFDRGGILPPLTLHIDHKETFLPTPMRALLRDPARHWVHLSLCLDPTTFWLLLAEVQSATGAWSQVQHLRLCHHRQTIYDSMKPTWFFARLASTGTQVNKLPSLKGLYMEEIELSLSGSVVTPSHTMLSTLRLTRCTVSFDMMKLLLDPHNLPCLQDLSLVHTSPVDRLSDPLSMALHPGIRRLNVRGVPTNAFLSMLTFPNLEVASISYAESSSTHIPVAMSHFLEQSGRNLHTLSLEGEHFRADVGAVAAAITPCLPALRRLHVPNLEIFRELLDKEEGVLPQLEVVSCTRILTPITKVEVDAILAYLEQEDVLTGTSTCSERQ
ncbi:hypothetical protein BKA70DRAFT_1231046 [Coprinopsis sp. MPI-PUGE-AT-0042]|nr:hypothetical protein BKA70DRAFT_1231046 [Coprinopsis sp. MPI-PUGE-AT-0042]